MDPLGADSVESIEVAALVFRDFSGSVGQHEDGGGGVFGASRDLSMWRYGRTERGRRVWGSGCWESSIGGEDGAGGCGRGCGRWRRKRGPGWEKTARVMKVYTRWWNSTRR